MENYNIEMARDLLDAAIDYSDENDWDQTAGCLDEAMGWVAKALTEAEGKLDESE